MDLYRSGCVPDGKKEAPSQYGGNMNRLFALEFFTGFRCIVQQIGKEHDHIRYIQWQCGKIVHLKVDADPFFDRFGCLGVEERVEDRVVRVDQKQPVGLHSGYGTQILLGSFILLIQQKALDRVEVRSEIVDLVTLFCVKSACCFHAFGLQLNLLPQCQKIFLGFDGSFHPIQEVQESSIRRKDQATCKGNYTFAYRFPGCDIQQDPQHEKGCAWEQKVKPQLRFIQSVPRSRKCFLLHELSE